MSHSHEQPQSVQPEKKKRKRSVGKIIAIVVAAIILVPVLAIGAILGISYLRYQNEAAPTKIDPEAKQSAPLQNFAYLDDRYAEGARPLEIDGAIPKVKGFTADRSQLVVHVMEEALGYIPSNHQIRLYDVQSGNLAKTYDGVADCSEVTESNSIFCTQHELYTTAEKAKSDGSQSMKARTIVEIDLASGDIKNRYDAEPIGSVAIDYIGEVDGDRILVMASSDGLGQPSFTSVLRLSADGSTVWDHHFKANEVYLNGCALVNSSAALACNGLPQQAELSSGQDSTLYTFDVKSGDVLKELEIPSFAQFADEGFKASGVGTGGVDSGASNLDKVFNYSGEDISDQFKDSIEADFGSAQLVPSPERPVGQRLVTYPLGSYFQGTFTDVLVINQNGETVLKSNVSDFASGLDAPDMVRSSDGEKLFTGLTKAVSANGAAVVYWGDETAASGTLFNVESGEPVYEIPSANSDVSFAGQAISFGGFAKGGLTVLLPGK